MRRAVADTIRGRLEERGFTPKLCYDGPRGYTLVITEGGRYTEIRTQADARKLLRKEKAR